MTTVNQSEAARRLGVSRRTVKRRIDAGELPTVDTPDGVHVVLPDPAAPTPAHGHAQADAHPMPTPQNVSPARQLESELNRELTARLEHAESRIDRLLETVQEQNRTIQAQTIRLAQMEGRMIDARAAETPVAPQEPVIETIYPRRVVVASERGTCA